MFGIGRNQQNVVSMMSREHERRNAPIREVETYWRALCEADTIPARSRIDPRGIEGALENAFLAERIAPGMARIRVAGSHLLDLMGMEVSGMPLSSLFAPPARDELQRHVTRVFAGPSILRARLRGEDGFGKPAMEASLLLLPMRSDMGDVSRALGCLVTQGRIGRVPRRFVLEEIQTTPVFNTQSGPAEAIRPTDPENAYLRQRVPRVHQFDEPATPFTPKVLSGLRPNLRIVVSNDD